MQNTDAIFGEVRRLVGLLSAEERLALIRDIVTAPFTYGNEKRANQEISHPSAISDDMDERRRVMQSEQEKWYNRPADERLKYAGAYVALSDGEVVDSDPEQRALHLRVREKFGRKPIPIIPAEQSATPEYVIRSPKLGP